MKANVTKTSICGLCVRDRRLWLLIVFMIEVRAYAADLVPGTAGYKGASTRVRLLFRVRSDRSPSIVRRTMLRCSGEDIVL